MKLSVKLCIVATIALLVTTTQILAGELTDEQAKLTPDEAKSIAKEAFLWGMHPVALYHLRYNYAQNEKSHYFVGINRLRWVTCPQSLYHTQSST